MAKKVATKKKTTTKSNNSKSCPLSSSICQKYSGCVLRRGSVVLGLAGLTLSLVLWFTGSKESAAYVGLLIPTVLILGNYCNKS